ncbi:MAG: hypothetical protein EWV63_11325 [Microcystis aeruginosa Ma_OC_H_19870700_S124]|uniref:Uncharacterized protein n=1 Tax=Microcystis aeruginosa Ma_OC_H_19870700_S124 TaxID=2486262 RepID=A0A552ALI8_MICAE|nr:MAG: hypothetical protein EWV63_11325 [Microcystis aeruginosa Ma_OC_H_19870700_S124]
MSTPLSHSSFYLPKAASNFCQSTKLGFLRGNSRLKLGITCDFITQSMLLAGSTPPNPSAH